MIARKALVAEGCSVQAWARLSLVHPICSHAMAGTADTEAAGSNV